MDPARLTPERLTARDVVADRSLSAVVHCGRCNKGFGFDVWRVGDRLGDTPLQQLKLTCRRCGSRAAYVSIDRTTGGTGETVLTIPLKRPVSSPLSGLYFEP